MKKYVKPTVTVTNIAPHRELLAGSLVNTGMTVTTDEADESVVLSRRRKTIWDDEEDEEEW